MNQELRVLELELEISRREVLRNLGYPRSKQPSERVNTQIEIYWPKAIELLSEYYSQFNGKQVRGY